MSFFNELRRRNVLRVAAAYVVAAWLLIQVAETIFPLFGFGDTPARITVILLAVALGYFAVDKFVFEPARDAARAKKYAGIGRELGLDYFYSPDLIVDLGNGRYADAAGAWAAGLEASGHDSELVARVFEALENPALVTPTIQYINALGLEAGPARELDLALLLPGRYEEFLGEVKGDTLMTLWAELARPVRRLPAFRELVMNTGMVVFWNVRGWPDLCRPAGVGFVCD